SLFSFTDTAGRRDPASAGGVVNPPPAPLGFADRVAVDNAPLSAGDDGSRPAGHGEPKIQETAMNPPPTLLTLPLAGGEKTKARDILAAIRTLQRIEQEQRPATPDERQSLARFPGFGPVALSLFPNPVTGRYKDDSWQALGEELRA